MKRSEIREFLKDGADAVNLPFEAGRITEFNSFRSNEYPMAWLQTLQPSTEIVQPGYPYDEWQVIIHIAQLDKVDSSPSEYEAIVDECDLYAQKFIKKINDEVSGYALITLSGISREPFIKKHADCLTGVILSFNLSSPDTTNLCE